MKKPVPMTQLSPAAVAPVPPRPAFFHPAVWMPILLFAFAFFFLLKGQYKLVWGFLAAEALWQLATARAFLGSVEGRTSSAALTGALAPLFACLAMLALAAGTFPSYHWMFPRFPMTNPTHFHWILVFLLIRLVFAFKSLQMPAWISDLKVHRFHLLFFALFLGGAWLRLHRLGDIPGTYWDDCAMDIINARKKTEMNSFDFLLALGSEEPFFSYLGGLMSFLFQDARSYVIHKMTLILVGMVSLWLFYLLGKEMGGRRVGLVMMGFAAVDTSLIMLSSQVMLHFNTLTLGTSVALLFFIRLYKKRDLKHFLQWGVATAFGPYTYVAYRALLPLLVFAPLLWVLSDKRERDEMKPGEWALMAAVAGACVFYCLYSINFFGYPSMFSKILASSGFLLPGLLLAVLLPGLCGFWVSASQGGRHRQMTGWMVGSLQFMLLSASVLWHPRILGRLSSLDIYGGLTFIQRLDLWGLRFKKLMSFLFYGGGNVWDDGFFAYPTALLVVCGAAYAVGRPRWLRFWLLLLSLAGVGTFVLSADSHTGKVLASAVPLYMLGSLAVVRLWDTLGSVFPALRSGLLTAVVFLSVLVASGMAAHRRVYRDWMDGYHDNTSITVLQAHQDAKAGYRVYLAASPDFPSLLVNQASADVLLEGSGVGFLQKENVIDLGPGEKEPDVVVLYAPDQAPPMEALAAAHPDSRVTDVTEERFIKIASDIKRLVIPFASLSGGSVPGFKTRRAASNEWLRTYYTHNFLARGVFWYQDRNADLNAPHPPCNFGDVFTASLTGGLRVDRAGRYRVNYASPIPAVVKVDGRRVVTDRPWKRKAVVKKSAVLKLGAGEHRIEILCDYRNRIGPAPVVEFRPADQPQSPPMAIGAPPPDPAKK